MTQAHFSTSDLASFIAFPISFVAVMARFSLSFLNSLAKSCRRSVLILESFFQFRNVFCAFFTFSIICSLVITSYSWIISSVAGFTVFIILSLFKDLLRLYPQFYLLLTLIMLQLLDQF